jgi:hypothetical protein
VKEIVRKLRLQGRWQKVKGFSLERHIKRIQPYKFLFQTAPKKINELDIS